ncbi:rhodanese-like domain-containing protein [Terrilactibacillus sp. S3-3]|nr:rhodanese-like domain-containing protein [Terrilactibacillus sp. S3-3]
MIDFYLIITVLAGFSIFVFSYRRYFPIHNVPCTNLESSRHDSDIMVVDVRDYNERAGRVSGHVLPIPFAYLKRFYHDIPKEKSIHVVAGDAVDCRLALRFLMRKGFTVAGYSLTRCPCRKRRRSI